MSLAVKLAEVITVHHREGWSWEAKWFVSQHPLRLLYNGVPQGWVFLSVWFTVL